jgi:3-(3-hydroxy-phenyl)propionate hydroxylase
LKQHFEVAIVGCGPVGATLANFLGQAGISTVIIDRQTGIYPLPRAIHFDGEIMRVFQNIGLKTAVLDVARAGIEGMHFVNAESKTLLIRGGTSADGPHACANNYYFHQPELETVLRNGLGRFSNVTLLEGHEVETVTVHSELPHAKQANLAVRNLANNSVVSINTRYVVGCDGARSLVRKTMQSTVEDLGLHQPWLVFDVILHEFALQNSAKAKALPRHTVQHCNPLRPMTYCFVNGQRRRWEIMLMPGDDPVEMARPENLWPLISKWLSPDDARLERAVVYTFHSSVTKGWRAGPLMVAGDAAHQMPPFLGQGLCAGIRDAANLAWKLNAVLKLGADDFILDSYETERSAHVRTFIELAVKLGQIIQTTDVRAAHARDAQLLSEKPETFAFPAPQLAGVGPSSDITPIGRTFGQPILQNGQLLDDRVGQNFAIICDESCTLESRDTFKGKFFGDPVILHSNQEPALAQWLKVNQWQAFLLRPDRYIQASIGRV